MVRESTLTGTLMVILTLLNDKENFMSQTKRYALYDKATGVCIGAVDCESEPVDLEDEHTGYVLHNYAECEKHRFEVDSINVSHKRSMFCARAGHGVVCHEHEEPPLVIPDEAKEHKANATIRKVLDELTRYEIMPALVVDKKEYEEYKAKINEAIATQERKDLVLPEKPEWFI